MKTGLRFVPGLVDLQRNGHEKRKEEIKIVWPEIGAALA
jgi:hypothetical protein